MLPSQLAITTWVYEINVKIKIGKIINSILKPKKLVIPKLLRVQNLCFFYLLYETNYNLFTDDLTVEYFKFF